MKSVRFKVPNGGYNAGEIAGFDDAIADRLINWGVAEEQKEKKKPAPKQEEPKQEEVKEEKQEEPTTKRRGRRKVETPSTSTTYETK